MQFQPTRSGFNYRKTKQRRSLLESVKTDEMKKSRPEETLNVFKNKADLQGKGQRADWSANWAQRANAVQPEP